jgi:antirestriction protein ArdC
MSKKKDIYQAVTNTILAALEEGTVPWVRPWNAEFPRNGSTGRHYSGVNTPLLWYQASLKGYESNEWFSFNQAKKMGGMVRKGERGTMIVFFKPFKVTDTDKETGEKKRKTIPLLRYWTVFNREQIDGLPESKFKKDAEPLSEEDRRARAEEFIKATGADIDHGGHKACYIPSQDRIQLPRFETFETPEGYYSTSAHELVHWTGHKSRKDRDQKGIFGTESYAFEELVAELGSAFVCSTLQIEGALQHPEYIGHWIKVLRDDKRALIRASSQARQAHEFLLEATGMAEEEVAEAA